MYYSIINDHVYKYLLPDRKNCHTKTRTGNLEGTLMLPEPNTTRIVALLIAGSGPTDRDGNNLAMKNNSLKMLAAELNKKGIASLRYDKRGIGNSRNAGLKEGDLRFENYVNDAKAWIAYLKKELIDNISSFIYRK